MRILGISAFYHDSAAALVDNGIIIAAAQEERFNRKKHYAGFPSESIKYCLRENNCNLSDIDQVVFYDKPFLKFERILETYLQTAPRGFKSFLMSMPVWLKEKLFLKNLLQQELKHIEPNFEPNNDSLLFSEHHLSHAASAFYPSPFDQAVILTMDGVGEWATTSLAVGDANTIRILKEIHFPHSLGLLYSAFTYYLGFKVNSGEYKVMGLAPYGTPKYAQTILDHLINLRPDGSFKLNMEYFDYCSGLRMTSTKFNELFGAPPRKPETALTQRDMDLAASIQAVTEEIVLKIARFAVNETGIKNLCLAGGVALNCVANGKILRAGIVDHLWVQPAAGDAGGALGAALVGHYIYKQQPRPKNQVYNDNMNGSYLGPSFSQEEIEKRLTSLGAHFITMSSDEIITTGAKDLADGKAVGWFQGRMEFGPRALGGRSILADPRSSTMQSILNLKVKFRESFRPFAPSVLREDLKEWFDLDCDSPYMLLVAQINETHKISMSESENALFGLEKLNTKRSTIPAVTHVDYSARIQTVHKETNPLYHKLIAQFKTLTGCPVLVNTSFNVRGEPIVCSPEDAFRCFMGTDIERLIIGNCYLRKEDQENKASYKDYINSYELD